VQEFFWPVRVYYEDTDSGGVVYHSNYLNFMERARTEWLRAAGFEQDRLLDEQGCLFVVRSMHIDFLRPARFNQLLDVGVRLEAQRKASMTVRQSIYPAAEREAPLCSAEVKLACLDAASFRPRPIPREILAEIACER